MSESIGPIKMRHKKILIFDEGRFAKVCNALLQLDGYVPEHIVQVQELKKLANFKNFDLIITSYPYGVDVLDRLKNKDIPVVVLSDCVDNDLLNCLKKIKTSFCMIKPVDFSKFSKIIKTIMTKKMERALGYEIL